LVANVSIITNCYIFCYSFIPFALPYNNVFNVKIPKKSIFPRTKTEATANNMLVPYSVTKAIQDLNEISCLDVSTEGNKHGSLKLFPVVAQYFREVYGIKSKLTDLNSTPNETS
jgi:hypothetical protein